MRYFSILLFKNILGSERIMHAQNLLSWFLKSACLKSFTKNYRYILRYIEYFYHIKLRMFITLRQK